MLEMQFAMVLITSVLVSHVLDHTYRGTPVSKMYREDILSVLKTGACYAYRDPTVSVSDEDWFWIKMRLEIELLRRDLGLAIK